MRTTELVTCPRNAFDWLGPAGVRAVVIRWLRLVASDAELAPYLIGLDRPWLARRLTALLAVALGDPGGDGGRAAGGAWRRLGLTDEQHWRVLDYLAAVLCGLGLPVDTVVAAQRAVAGDAHA
ncbi:MULTISPECIES: globin [unclassified Micromonospora]|uniref:globin n=1 Tax=unclassified Micromonospora TaxID=2617518 RepID=UPI001C5D17BB|nr:globin [Micromonospora sp. RL09-050-HVF-A]MBW4705074.1 globin [Micromonospora sp. RL09-050-HVF-A]